MTKTPDQTNSEAYVELLNLNKKKENEWDLEIDGRKIDGISKLSQHVERR